MSKFKASMSEFFKNGKPFFAVIFIQFGFAGMDILSKAALNEGISNYVFVVYRHAVATVVMAPFALIFDRKIRPKMTRSVFIKIIFLGLLEPVIDQNLFFMGMKATTATFTAAMVNILPAITFVMACILRLEKLNLKGIRSQAKVVGTITTVAGAMVMTLMKGPIIELFWTKGRTYHEVGNQGVDFRHSIKGATMIAVGCFSWSGFMVLQAITLKSYPAELSLTVWICLMGTIEGALVALIMERGNTAVWALKWNTSLVAVLYTGIVCSGLAFYISGIVMKTRGPVFVTAFSPLSMIIVAVMGSIILAEQMYLGRVMGAIVIVAGLYLVVWGKSKDQDEVVKSLSADEELPQIQDKEFKENRNDKIITIKTSDGVSDHHNPINGLA
ncbi:putative EamA domain-containing protein [Helianthus annuus]|nr:putative EamA domain-containing protein [Helianthus annuus]